MYSFTISSSIIICVVPSSDGNLTSLGITLGTWTKAKFLFFSVVSTIMLRLLFAKRGNGLLWSIAIGVRIGNTVVS